MNVDQEAFMKAMMATRKERHMYMLKMAVALVLFWYILPIGPTEVEWWAIAVIQFYMYRRTIRVEFIMGYVTARFQNEKLPD